MSTGQRNQVSKCWVHPFCFTADWSNKAAVFRIRIWASRIRILPSTSKKIWKNLDFYILRPLNNLLSLKTDVNVPSVIKKAKKNWGERAGSGSGSASVIQKHGSVDPKSDPYRNVTDPEHS